MDHHLAAIHKRDWDDDRSRPLEACAIAFLIITWPLFALRIYVRSRIIKSLGRDDYVMLGCQLSCTACCLFAAVGGAWGIGRHIQYLSLDGAERALFVCASLMSHILADTP